MKRSTAEPLLILSGSVFIFLAMFHSVLGLGESAQLPLMLAGGGCWAALVLLQRRWKAQRISADTSPPPQHVSRARFWLILFVLIVGTLSGPLWLPYTGSRLSFPTLILTSIISCILAVGVFLIAWRRRSPKV